MEDYNSYNYPPQEPAPAYNPYPAAPQPNTLVWGILGLALSCFFGFIFGIIGRSKGNAYIKSGGTLTGASKVGYILSLVAIICGIIGTVLFIIYVVLIARQASTISSIYSYYY